MSRKPLSVDPRLVLLHIAVISVLTLWVATIPAAGLLVAITAAALLGLGSPRSCVYLLAAWAMLVGVRALLVAQPAASSWRLMLPTISSFARLAPLTGAYFLFMAALPVSRFLAALQWLRVPIQVTLPLAVMLRFIPTLHVEFGFIRDALRTRGLPIGPLALLRSPIRTSELVVVPLIHRCVSVAEELSAAAVTRAIENPRPRGARVPLRWRRGDTVYGVCLLAGTLAVAYLNMKAGM